MSEILSVQEKLTSQSQQLTQYKKQIDHLSLEVATYQQQAMDHKEQVSTITSVSPWNDDCLLLHADCFLCQEDRGAWETEGIS